MNWIEQGLVALAIGLPAAIVIMLVATASKLTRLRFRPACLTIVTCDAIPEQTRAALDSVRSLLNELGFGYRYSTGTTRTIVTDDRSLFCSDVYQSADRQTHAVVSPSATPQQRQACMVTWISVLRSGEVFATVDCLDHTILSWPEQWTIRDEYLADVRKSCEAHRRWLAQANAAVSEDGLEFFRANKLASEQLVGHYERQGLLVARGGHHAIPWPVAIRFAWRLYLGQRRVAKAQQLALKAPPSALANDHRSDHRRVPPGLEGDIHAFEQHQAMQRAVSWSGRNKFKVFLLTGALFLAIGSLWISLTFLPVLLAVIALHEGGHYLAMRISGYRNVAVFFIPGLGGLASGEKPTAGPWEKLFVYLAGPMPGIALAVAGLIGQAAGVFEPPPWFQEFLLACLVINYFNMLPITPLDGGRVVETMLFARLPVARFLFAGLGVLAFGAFGLLANDTVILVIAVILALSLPHQWRVMRVDRAIERRGTESLDQRTAIERIFMALQHQKFAGWAFATRAAAATSLLPELQGRRAGPIEAIGGIAIYAACLLSPVVAAGLVSPQFRAIAMLATAGHNMVPDDVVAEPTRAQPAPKDWYAEVARAPMLPETQRLTVYLSAAEFAIDTGDDAKSAGFLKDAWQIAEKLPLSDYDRARTLLAMAGQSDEKEQRRRFRAEVVSGLEGIRDKRSVLLLADAKEQMALEHEDGVGASRADLLRQVVTHRAEVLPEGAHELVSARLALARMLDAEGPVADTEALLRQNIQGIPSPRAEERTRDALTLRTRKVEAQVELAWFLMAHRRTNEASHTIQVALAQVPERITMSWEYSSRQLREADLWAKLQHGQASAIAESWRLYEESRKGIPSTQVPALLHEVDRLIVAQASSDEALRQEAVSAIAKGLQSSQVKFAQSQLCSNQEAPGNWRSLRRQARVHAAGLVGLCAARAASS